MSYYDDNYGHWEIEDEEDLELYKRIQATNVTKKCKGCGRIVRIQSQYAYCNDCTEKIERGLDVG